MITEITTTYALMFIEDYSSNKGNPDFSETNFNTLEEAQEAFNKAIAEKYTEHGKTCEVQLWKFEGDEDPVMMKSECQESGLLPADAIIVTYQHITYMNYAYAIKDARKVNAGERYEDLHVSADHTYASWDEVYDNIDELKGSFEKKYGIFEKINSGSSIVAYFLKVN